ncbi:unnamed protein product [Blepharisma stoltei]|uniref:Uncharacterized protein n=1 Tax=Blepharisma stoltei TaxID=1481888 RepID=A0AAU9K2H0_9CILI|nr:unnamed protein product [Blepharisma stoltei]
MENQTYSWLLSLVNTRKTPLRILEAGLCRGDLLQEWYANDKSGIVITKTTKTLNKTSQLLTHFLNIRCPILEDYSPEKIIAYLYHQKGRKVLRAKEAINFSKNLMYGLQMRSIHMALPETYSNVMIKVKAKNENGEFKNELSYKSFEKENGDAVKDESLCERAHEMTLFIAEYIYRFQSEIVDQLRYDLCVDGYGYYYLIRLENPVFAKELSNIPRVRNKNRTNTIFLDQPPDPDEDARNLESAVPEFIPIGKVSDRRKSRESLKFRFDFKFHRAPNSPVFVKMIAKTIEKSHQKAIMREKLEQKRKMLYSADVSRVVSPNNESNQKFEFTDTPRNLNELIDVLGSGHRKSTSDVHLEESNNEEYKTKQSYKDHINFERRPSELHFATALATRFFQYERKTMTKSMGHTASNSKRKPHKNRLFQIYMGEREQALSTKYSSVPNSPKSCGNKAHNFVSFAW